MDSPRKSELSELLPYLTAAELAALDWYLDPLPSDFRDWAERLFPHYLKTRPGSVMHDYLSAELPRLTAQRGSRLCLLAPREEAKSTWVSVFYVLSRACSGSEPYIWVISDTQPQTRRLVANLARECQGNELLVSAYSGIVGPSGSYSADAIVLGNGTVIEGVSTGQNLRGRRLGADRPSLIVLDDPEGEQDEISPGRRAQNRDWFDNALLKAGDALTNIVVLGTAICPNCLVLDVAARPNWRSRIFQAVMSWPERMDLWEEWKALYLHAVGGTDEAKAEASAKARAFFEERRADMERGAAVSWAARHPLYDLMCEWAENPLSFLKERQNNPHNPDSCEWPAEYFDWDGFWFDHWPEEIHLRAMSLDPSKGADAHAGDYSAWIALARCGRGLWWIEADLMRRPVPRICSDGVAFAQRLERETRGRLDGMVIESNQFQSLIGPELVREAEKCNVILPLFEFNNLIRKEVRIRRLTGDLNRRIFRFRRTPGTKLLVQQLKEFPGGAHDDGPDALEMARRLAVELWAGKATQRR